MFGNVFDVFIKTVLLHKNLTLSSLLISNKFNSAVVVFDSTYKVGVHKSIVIPLRS
jgi:hypothetical protein